MEGDASVLLCMSFIWVILFNQVGYFTKTFKEINILNL